jgi:Xaa-Pro aminopeptidase
MSKNSDNSQNTKRRDMKNSPEFKKLMKSNWGNNKPYDFNQEFDIEELQELTAKRRGTLLGMVLQSEIAASTSSPVRKAHRNDGGAGELVIVIPSGEVKVRNNDCNYVFRPYSSFTYLTGLGVDYEPNSYLVIAKSGSTLYIPSTKDSSTKDYYLDAHYGEYWVGTRPKLSDFEEFTGIKTVDVKDYKDFIKNNSIIVAGKGKNGKLLESYLSEIRLAKDEFEINELQVAIDKTKVGFENMIKSFAVAPTIDKGERLIESKFYEIARIEGNAIGYDSIVASGNDATTLHWIRNTSRVEKSDLILLDCGIEQESLYTADITRCFPINGKFSKVQATVYNAVLDAADRVLENVKPGLPFKELNSIAFRTLIPHLAKMGILPISGIKDDEAVRRFMPHGTSHHLGLDVHDCTEARKEFYTEGTLKQGMVFTVEPGLYFKENDLTVPEKFRGIGVRIEDNVLVTESGCKLLSGGIPRTVSEVEEWINEVSEPGTTPSPSAPPLPSEGEYTKEKNV